MTLLALCPLLRYSPRSIPAVDFLAWGGAMRRTFGPLIANPKTLLLGAACLSRWCILCWVLCCSVSPYKKPPLSVSSVVLTGPTSIYLVAKMAPQLLGCNRSCRHSYMSLVPLIQPPIMKLFTTEVDRKIVMQQLRPVTRFEKSYSPIMCTIVISLLLPSVTALIGMLMLGNLFKKLVAWIVCPIPLKTLLMNTVTIMLATGTGLTMSAESFLNYQTILIIVLGLVAFVAGTALGVIFGKFMCMVDGGKPTR